MQGEQRKDTIYYLQSIGLLKGFGIRNFNNPNYIKHLTTVENYETLRKSIGSTHECKKRYPHLWKQYRISKVCFDRYNRFFRGRWTRPSMKGKFTRCLLCGRPYYRGEKRFMCLKCENNQSERFAKREKWKTDILREKIKKIQGSTFLGFEEAYAEIRRNFRRRITPMRAAQRKKYLKNYVREKWADPEKKKVLQERNKEWRNSYKGRTYRKQYREKWLKTPKGQAYLEKRRKSPAPLPKKRVFLGYG